MALLSADPPRPDHRHGRPWRGIGLLRALATVLVGLGFALGSSARMSDARQTLVIAVPSDPSSLDPGTNKAEPIGSEIILNVFDTLVAWKPPVFQDLEGRLASAWAVSPDGRTFAFTLRPGLKFQDGSDCDAQAVKFSIERTRRINPFMAQSFGLIDAVTVVDPLHLQVHLSQPTSAFPALLAQPQAAIVSPTAVAKYGAEFERHPVGTGPFVFRSHTADTSVVLERNPGYFRGRAKLERLIYRVIPDPSTRRLELKYGGIDIGHQSGQLASIPGEEVESLRRDPNIDVVELPSQIIRQLDFNNNRIDSPVHDLRVRQALSLAVDYRGLIDGVLVGLADRVYGPLPSSNWAFDEHLRQMAYTHDPVRARSLLAAAGYPPGKLQLVLYTFQGSLWANVATFLQANFADVGVQVTVRQTEFPSFRALHVAGQFDIALEGRQPWHNDPDAQITVGYLSSLANRAMTFRMPPDAALDGLILAAQSNPSRDQRKRLYARIQEELVARVPAVYLFSNRIILFKRKAVQGLTINTTPGLSEYWSVYKDGPEAALR
jgi:peptide/nickel transport system substrate-binding protein